MTTTDTARPDPSERPAEPFEVLVVCTGNICRSPAVERLLAVRLADDPGIRVASAGTHAVVGSGISAPMVPLLTGAGADGDGFTARQIDVRMIERAGVVLTLTRRHRSHVVELVPAAVRRTFTLRELARIADVLEDELPAGSPAVRFAALVGAAASRRSAHPGGPGADDVDDPYGRGDAAYADSYGQLEPAVATIVRVVRGA